MSCVTELLRRDLPLNLAHDVGSSELDRPGTDVEFEGDHLVGFACHQTVKDLQNPPLLASQGQVVDSPVVGAA